MRKGRGVKSRGGVLNQGQMVYIWNAVIRWGRGLEGRVMSRGLGLVSLIVISD